MYISRFSSNCSPLKWIKTCAPSRTYTHIFICIVGEGKAEKISHLRLLTSVRCQRHCELCRLTYCTECKCHFVTFTLPNQTGMDDDFFFAAAALHFKWIQLHPLISETHTEMCKERIEIIAYKNKCIFFQHFCMQIKGEIDLCWLPYSIRAVQTKLFNICVYR